ncbi:hypothetical protein T11_1734 [Trichinella zimbabwensis]|uniref:Uncharacterized protein n=1 Tax=Trichinella zimbabwensis TaxID=268475 RepID=A0A0V1HFJ0_9BILA|nr:hypothetical protein T11_1734 [Trichinella zimbabwensis]
MQIFIPLPYAFAYVASVAMVVSVRFINFSRKCQLYSKHVRHCVHVSVTTGRPLTTVHCMSELGRAVESGRTLRRLFHSTGCNIFQRFQH